MGSHDGVVVDRLDVVAEAAVVVVVVEVVVVDTEEGQGEKILFDIWSISF